MLDSTFLRRPRERFARDRRSPNASQATARADLLALVDLPLPALPASRVLRAALLAVSALGALSGTAPEAYGRPVAAPPPYAGPPPSARVLETSPNPALNISAQQEKYGLGIDDVVFIITSTGAIQSETRGRWSSRRTTRTCRRPRSCTPSASVRIGRPRRSRSRGSSSWAGRRSPAT